MSAQLPPEKLSNIADSVHQSLGCEEPTTKEVIKVLLEDIQLFDRKHHDRGPGNINRFGEKGVVVRMADKQARLERIIWDEVVPAVSEDVSQEYADMTVYGVIARLVRKGLWR